jgi:hypothetical protein
MCFRAQDIFVGLLLIKYWLLGDDIILMTKVIQGQCNKGNAGKKDIKVFRVEAVLAYNKNCK